MLGPIAATALALAVALLEGSSWMPVNNFIFGLIVVGLYVMLINIEHIWLRPYILGRSVHINEAIVFVAIIAAVIFPGVLGAFIILPVLASLVVIWNYLHARMLGLPPFRDEVPAAPVPDLERSDESKPESAPAHIPLKRNPRNENHLFHCRADL